MQANDRGTIARAVATLSRKIWFRATIFTGIAIAFALLAGAVGAAMPFRLSIELGQNSVGSLLQIIATAMLTATTFSVTAMVSAYASATTNATPRATQLLVADRTSQNALSTFVGAFVFAMVGIIALSTGYYDEEGRTILFVGTLVVIAVIVVTLLRWVSHLATFGRMADVIDRVERAAGDALEAYAVAPTLGARRATSAHDDWHAVFADESGYVAHVDVGALDAIATDAGVEILIVARPGRLADRRVPLVRVSRPIDDDASRVVERAFQLDRHRTYGQDPRLGVIALAEIGSRALSPATNDPGTAIDVLAALQRIFERAFVAEVDDEVRYPATSIAPPDIEDLLDDAVRPIARDGAAVFEVHARLQKCLASLAACSPEHADLLAATARYAAARAHDALDGPDRARLSAVEQRLWRGV